MFVHAWYALGVEGDGQGCPCDAFARAFHISWKEIKVLIIDSNTKTTSAPEAIEVLARTQFGTATKITGIGPLTAGRLNTVYVIRLSNIKPDVVLGIAPHLERRVRAYQKGADAP